MPQRHWWADSPFIILPLCAFAFGLAVVPFWVWGADHAAQFYGSFVAAIVAAGAVVGTTTMQAAFVRRQKRDEARQREVQVATDLFIWLRLLKVEAEFVANRFEEAATRTEPTPVDKIMVRDLGQEIRQKMELATTLRQPLSFEIVSSLARYSALLDSLEAHRRLGEKHDKTTATGLANILRIHARRISAHRRALGTILKESGISEFHFEPEEAETDLSGVQ